MGIGVIESVASIDEINKTTHYGQVKTTNAKVAEFMQDLQPTGNEIESWAMKLEEAKTLKELRETWKVVPPMIVKELEQLKNTLKEKLGGKATN